MATPLINRWSDDTPFFHQLFVFSIKHQERGKVIFFRPTKQIVLNHHIYFVNKT